MKLLFACLWASFNYVLFPLACEQKGLNIGVTCVTDYWLRVSCELNTTADPLNKSTHYWLEFIGEADVFDGTSVNFECHLMNIGDYYKCSVDAKLKYQKSFISADYFKVNLRNEHETPCVSMNYIFKPVKNIKLNTPSNLTILRNTSGYLFTWISNYESHPYIKNLKYKLVYHKSGFAHQPMELHLKEQTLFINDTFLAPNTEYTAKVCSSVPSQERWSEYSDPVHWRTVQNEVMDNDIFQLLWNIVLPVCAVSAILLCLLITPTARLKLKAWTAIPTPAPYFQPLFSDYKGNFQDWLVSHGNHGDVLKTEELLKIDSLTEAKPLKEAERYSSEFECHSTQCQSLCIGPGEEDRCMGGPVDAPAPATVGQSDMPVSLPLLKASFAKIFGSQSLDPADTIEGDSGCEDPTPSLDSCWPQGTLNIEPEGVCFSEDYCTLSDSHNGLIPTVVFRPAACSKENDVPPSDNSHNSLGSSLDVDGVES